MRLVGHGRTILDLIKFYEQQAIELADMMKEIAEKGRDSKHKCCGIEITKDFILFASMYWDTDKCQTSIVAWRLYREGEHVSRRDMYTNKSHFIDEEATAVMRVFPELKKATWHSVSEEVIAELENRSINEEELKAQYEEREKSLDS